MYHAIVRRKARGIFESLGHSRDAMERWFERLFRLFPEIEFEIKRVVAKGWPWDTLVAVEWTDSGKAADGRPYVNAGAHWIRLRWGKAVDIHAYLDTEVLADACRRMAAAGIEEAAAPPITS